jgi:hypothetical protein
MADEYYSVKLWIADKASTTTAPNASNPWAGEVSTETLFLNVESIQKQISRSPSVIALPELRRNFGGPNIGEPVAFPLDLGVTSSDTISISGVTADLANTSVAQRGTNAPIAAIERFVRTSWRFAGLSLSSGNTENSFFEFPLGGPRITIPQAPGYWYTYPVVVMNYRSDRVGGQQFWKWSITLQVTAWPPFELTQNQIAIIPNGAVTAWPKM